MPSSVSRIIILDYVPVRSDVYCMIRIVLLFLARALTVPLFPETPIP